MKPRGLAVVFALSALALIGCRAPKLPGIEETASGAILIPGVFEDACPRWSHDGKQIAFLRFTTDRRGELFLANPTLERITPILGSELLSPDRDYRTSRIGVRAPETLAWSPDDRYLIFSRLEWMTFPDGEKLPGTGLWQLDTRTQRAAPLAIHPKHYAGAFYFYRSPAFSPDGRHLAFVGEGLHGETALFVRPTIGGSAEAETPRFDPFGDIDWPTWSPDGKQVAFRQGILRGYTADGIETIRIIEPGGVVARRAWATTPDRYDSLLHAHPKTSATQNPGADSGRSTPRITGLSWAPDGRSIAFTVAQNPAKPVTSDLWLISVDAEGRPTPRAAVKDPATNSDGYSCPVWLDPDTLGALRIGSDNSARAISISGLSDLPASAIEKTLADLPSGDVDWSPDGRFIAAAGFSQNVGAGRRVGTTLRIIRLDR